MIHRRNLLRAAALLTCTLIALPGCGESGGVSATPVKGTPLSEGASFQPQVAPAKTPAAEAAPSGPAAAGKKQAAPTEVVE